MAALDGLALNTFLCLCVMLGSFDVHGEETYLLPSGQTIAVKRGTPLEITAVQRNQSDSSSTPEYEPAVLLRGVTELKVWGLSYWPPLPETSSIERIDIIDVESVGVFGGCLNLTLLIISAGHRFSCPPRWLERCVRLRELTLENFLVADARAVIDATPPLRALALMINELQDMKTLIRNSIFPTPRGGDRSITELRIFGSNIPLSDIDYSTWLQLSGAIAEQLATLPRLQDLIIDEVRGFDLCPEGNFSSVTYRSLESLTVVFSNTTRLCLRELRAAPRLTHLIFKYNAIESPFLLLQFRELFSVRAPILYANVYQEDWLAEIKGFHIEREDYFELTNGSRRANVTFKNLRVSVDCEWCRSGWLARALREGLVTAPGVSCRDGRAPQHLRSLLECDRINCTANCKCRRDWSRNVVIADCHDARLAALPADLLHLQGLVELNASDNYISDLPERLPDNLLRLDLSGNPLWPQSDKSVSALFSTRNRRVWLAGYPLVCACDHRPTLLTLQQHHDQVEDYENLICTDKNNKKLRSLSTSDLCKSRDLLTLKAAQREAKLTAALGAALAGAVGALCVAAAVYWRRTLRAFLFARGYCLCCLQEDALDADRRYDVFLSYCHADHQMVLEELLPVLDGEYSVCEHTRDWCPGEMIPAQIMWSVEQSRRTLVVMSRSFVDSLWGVLEFRTAHASGLSAGCVRVVMVVLDDVLESGELHGELRAYVQLNTYVRWGEPFFWDKLRYALPHRPSPAQTSHSPRPPHDPKMAAMAAIAAGCHHTSPLVRQPDTLALSESDETPAAYSA